MSSLTVLSTWCYVWRQCPAVSLRGGHVQKLCREDEEDETRHFSTEHYKQILFKFSLRKTPTAELIKNILSV